MIGIDYSLSSPSVVISKSDNPEDCQIFCYKQTKKHASLSKNITMKDYPEWGSSEERYLKIANDILQFIKDHEPTVKEVFIEGYSYGSVGNVFDIAEGTSVLKQGLFANNIKINIVPPTANKKFATGKGNANKFLMFEQFKTNWPTFDLESSIDPIKKATDKKIPAPLTDIIDAYFIMCYGLKATSG